MTTYVCLTRPVYLFLGLMMMYLLLRTFHKMADLHGLTTFLQLPRCEDSDLDDDREPIVENESVESTPPQRSDMLSSKPLDPSSQPSYNSISASWAVWRQGEESQTLPLMTLPGLMRRMGGVNVNIYLDPVWPLFSSRERIFCREPQWRC